MSATASLASRPSGATASRTRLPIAGRDERDREPDDDQRDDDAQREREREHVELRRGAGEHAEQDLGEEQAAEHRARDLDRGDEELAEVLGEQVRRCR